MRKIEVELLDSIKSRKDWSKANSSCTFHRDSCHVYLHGKNIAVLDFNQNELIEMRLYSQGYLTYTTKSKLNTLLDLATKKVNNIITRYSIYQKQYTWYLNCINYNTETQEFTEVFNKEFEEGISIKVNE